MAVFKRLLQWLLLLGLVPVLVGGLSGCNEKPRDSQPPTAASNGADTTVPDGWPEGWIGRWQGPEGTYLDIAKSGPVYLLTIQSLDTRDQFEARWDGNRLAFSRAGQAEFVRATDGQGTGMKWLLDKQQCLTIRLGEGFCRD